MRYGILGATLVSGAPVGPRQVRTVLATLLSRANEPVTTEVLAGELWSGPPPETRAAVVQCRVSALRKLLRPALPARSPQHVIHTHQGAYTLVVVNGELDADEFLRRTDQGLRAAARGDLAEASRSLREGLALWRGDALADTGRGPLLTGYAGMLAQRRLAALEQRFAVDIERGAPAEAINGLTEQLARDAAQENFAALLVTALAETNRGPQAQEVFETTRAALAANGTEPGARLCQARDLIRTAVTLPTRQPVPAQVPARTPDFTGRAELLTEVRVALGEPEPGVVALSGPGGIGKSTLAVQAAHLTRRGFPDGQLVADLTGPADPAEVLRRFLLALGVPEAAVPDGLVERQQLWRTRTADARLLVLLDDARDEAQVRALLPAGPGCATLVTARRRLSGLAGTTTIPVAAFGPEETRELIDRIAGADRLAADPGAARELVRACAGLPLAARVVGAKLADRPHETPRELAQRIAGNRLAELRAGDLDVRATIERSYAGCGAAPRRALRLLSAVRTAALSPAGLARLLGMSAEDAREVAEELVAAHLLVVPGRDEFDQVRYRVPELVAEFAGSLAEPHEPHDAVSILLDFHTEAAGVAQRRPARWCAAEAGDVLAVVTAALGLAWWERAWRLADLLADAGQARPGTAAAHRAAVLAAWAARRWGDPRAEATSSHRLAEVYWHQAKAGAALRCLTAAAERFRRLRDQDGLARTLITESDVLVELGRVAEARQRLTHALDLARQAEVHAAALYQLSGVLADAGEFSEAERCCHESLRRYRLVGDPRGQIAVRKRLADVFRRTARYQEAAALLADALTEARAIGDPHWEAHVLRSRGEVLRYTGNVAAARRDLARSLELFTKHEHRHAAAYSLHSLADLYAQTRQYQEAAEALERCQALFEALADRRGQAYTLRSLGALSVRTGRWIRADQALRAARELFEELSLRWFSQDAARALARTRQWSHAG